MVGRGNTHFKWNNQARGSLPLEILKGILLGSSVCEIFTNDICAIMKNLVMKLAIDIQLGNIVTIQENYNIVKRNRLTLRTGKR